MTELCEALACKYHGKAFFDRLEQPREGLLFMWTENVWRSSAGY